MRKTTLLLCAVLLPSFGTRLMADTAETIPFLTQLLPANETPPITDTSTGNVIIYVHVIRDGNGNVTSGSVDFDVATKFSGAVTVNGLHIHNAPAGVAGSIVIPTDVSSIAVDAAGRVKINKQVQFPQAAPTVAVSTIVDLLANPQNYYVNIHTTDHPSGAMRGQLLAAESKVLMGLMNPNNEHPPVPVNGSAVATVVMMRARDDSGNVALAETIFNMEYSGFDAAAGTAFVGFHIHNGGASVDGPVIINSGIGGGANSVAINANGSGNLNYEVAITPSDRSFATEVATINGLFDNPGAYYINVHTNVFGGGVARDQMRNTDSGTFQVSMLPSNETPPIVGLAATGTAAVSIYTLRNADGTVAGGTAIFDVNFRGFPAPTTFIGLHIHNGPAGVAGPVTISSGLGGPPNSATSDSGNGNVYKIVTAATTAGIATLNQYVVQDPSQAYVNLHTTVNGGGAIRSQLAGALAKPAVGGVAANSSTVAHAAPGGILSIYGTNLSAFTTGLVNFPGITALPTAVNGVTATIGGVNAPFYFVSPLQINAQVPFEAKTGVQQLVVSNAAGAGASFNVTVDAVAPSLFILDPNTGLAAILKNSDFSLITPDNPVTAGDVIVIYSTGLGQTTPPVATGGLAPGDPNFANTATATVNIGGQDIKAIYSFAAPGFAGLYQTAVAVPAGVSGSVAVVLKAGATSSNSANIAVQ